VILVRRLKYLIPSVLLLVAFSAASHGVAVGSETDLHFSASPESLTNIPPTYRAETLAALVRELRELSEGRDTFHKESRPLIATSELGKLLAVPDEEFLKYTEQQLRELVEKFAGIKGNMDFLTNIPTPFYGRFSAPKPTPQGKGSTK
jgi:hypothetical protein